MIRFAPGLALIVASMFSSANLKAAPTDNSTGITFPSSSAQKWFLPNGLTVVVQEDHSAPVASVQAWCATGSIDEDEHLGAGLSHILEHMLFKGTKKRSTNVIAQKIQDVGLHQRLHIIRSHGFLDRRAEGRRRHCARRL